MHGFFNLIFTICLLALITAMLRPALASKFIVTPTRKKILVRLVPALIVIAALSGATKPESADDSGTAFGTANAYDERSQLKQAIANARDALQDAQRSGRIGDPRCYMVANMLQQELSRSIADLGGYQTAAAALANHARSVRNACG
ncbi:hypothetical protein [Ralstonia solanacearum]|uniref:hypothetical protein n=1 Tax=Ralstonia solanacearum TaxID=305 RepID=UPI002366F241|nr:hypothetical protein [Ralstonia solanacearum]MDD7803743.1 hypothetical protein [Ralstonia solanacearum]